MSREKYIEALEKILDIPVNPKICAHTQEWLEKAVVICLWKHSH
jgi:hypothetical protein